MIRLFITLTLMVCFQLLKSQDFLYDWSYGLGGSEDEYIHSIHVDSYNNVFSTGGFLSSMDFDQSAASLIISPNGSEDAFLTKTDELGNFQWVKTFGGSAVTHSRYVYLDSNDNIYLTGYFSGTTDFDPGIQSYVLTSAGDWDIFILKLDPNGNFLWANRFGSSGTDIGYLLMPDMNGNIYFSGVFMNSVDFDPGLGAASLTSNGHLDVVVCKFDEGGNLLWYRGFGGNDWDNSYALELDQEQNLYVSGAYKYTVNFDELSMNGDIHTSNGMKDMFMTKYNAEGVYQWTKTMGGSQDDYIFIEVTDSGDIYGAGHFKTSMDIDPGPAVMTLTSVGQNDIVFARFNSNGEIIWAKSIGGSGIDAAGPFQVLANGDMIVSGEFQGTFDFDPGDQEHFMESNGGFDVFLIQLGANGEYVRAMEYGAETDDYCYSMKMGHHDDVFSAGWVSGDIDFDPNSDNGFYDHVGMKDLYLMRLKWGQCEPVYVDQSVLLCPNESISVGNSIYSQSGDYTDVLIQKSGCDSIVNTHIEQSPALNLNVDAQGQSLISLEQGATYQWVDCNNGYLEMSGATSQQFQPFESGNYAVILTSGNCSDTSSCYTYIIDNIAVEEEASCLRVYPNPFIYECIIEIYQTSNVEIHHASGQLVYQRKLIPGIHHLKGEDWPSGLYTIRSTSHSETCTKTILKLLE